jgi:hypothetical protein
MPAHLAWRNNNEFTFLKNTQGKKAHCGFALKEFLHKRSGQNKIAYF